MDWFLLILGLSICTAVLLVILWSIYVPDRRVWPPDTYDKSTALLVWGATAGLASCIVVPAFLQWGAVDWLPDWVRFGIGLPLILVGNLGVWSEVARFGISQTGGAQGTLRTQGLYAYSRNPQYVADLAIVIGWGLMSAAPTSMIVGVGACLCLFAAPFAEETWLAERYGHAYNIYRARVRRFI
jgi:protein-S-isoprenylcysteine O-methyltransferase Ste14